MRMSAMCMLPWAILFGEPRNFSAAACLPTLVMQGPCFKQVALPLQLGRPGGPCHDLPRNVTPSPNFKRNSGVGQRPHRTDIRPENTVPGCCCPA
eukprot:955567-Alexandrium_andersonii.AAC.1